MDTVINILQKLPNNVTTIRKLTRYLVENNIMSNIFELTNQLNNSCSISERVYTLLNNIYNVPLCPECKAVQLKFRSLKLGYCKYCSVKCNQKVIDRIRYENNKKNVIERVVNYRKNNRAKIREYDKNYYHNDDVKRKRKEYRNKNKDHINSRTQLHRKSIPEKVRQQRVNDYQKNSEVYKKRTQKQRKTDVGRMSHKNSNAKRKCKIKNSDIKTEFLIYMKNKTKTCSICNSDLIFSGNNTTSAQLDHFIPLNIGGTHTKNNVWFICKNCNLTRPKDGSDINKLTIIFHMYHEHLDHNQ